MAEIKAKGVDQTTGKFRVAGPGDSLSIGSTVDIVIQRTYDYSGNTQNNFQVLYPWSNPQKLSSPASLPTGNPVQAAAEYSPNGEYYAIGHNNPPYLSIYKISGTNFVNLLEPSTTLAGTVYSLAWSPNGEFLACGGGGGTFSWFQRDNSTFTGLSNPTSMPHTVSFGMDWSPNGEFLAVTMNAPDFLWYQRTGTTLTMLSRPSTLPTSNTRVCNWSPDGTLLAMAHYSSPYITIYQRLNGTTLTKISDPATLPTGNGVCCGWSPSGEFLAVGHSNSPYITIYQRSGTTLTKLDDPATLPPSVFELGWDSGGKYLGIGFSSLTTHFYIYERDGTTFTKLADPETAPSGAATYCLNWSPNRELLAIGHQASPYLDIYQTDSIISDGSYTIESKIQKTNE